MATVGAPGRSLAFDVVAFDQTTKAFERVAGRLDRLERKLDKLDGRTVKAKVKVDVDDRGLDRDVGRMGSNAADAFMAPFRLVATRIPVLMLVAVAAIVAAMPAAGMAAAGALILGFGAGIAGLAVIGALQNKKLRKDFLKTAKGIAKDFAELVGPVTDVLFKLTNRLRRTFDAIAPDLKEAFKAVAPGLDALFKSLLNIVKRLAPALPPLARAFSDLMKDLGPRLPRVFRNISDALIELARTIRRNPDMFGDLIEGLLNIVPLALKFVNKLAQIHAAITGFIKGLTSDTSTELDELGRKRIVPFEPQTKSEKLGAQIRDALQNAQIGDFTIVQKWVDNLAKAINKVDFTKMAETIGTKLAESAAKSTAVATAFTIALVSILLKVDWNQVASSIVAGLVIGLLKGSGLYEVGAWLVDGLLNGFKDRWAELVASTLWWHIRVFIDIVKALFGISSPSTVFYDIGADVVQGLINGVLAMMPNAVTSAGSIGSAIIDRFRNAGSWLTGEGRQIVAGLIRGIKSQIPAAVKAVSSGVSRINAKWRTLRNTRSTTAFVVNSVMAPLVRNFNKVANGFGAKAVAVPAMAGGGFTGAMRSGRLPAFGDELARGGPVRASRVGWTSRPTAIVGEGSRVYPEVVVPTDPKYRSRALKLFEQLGGKLMASGGALGFNSQMFLNPRSWLSGRNSDALKELQELPEGKWSDVLSEVPKKVGALALEAVKKFASMLGTAGGPGGWQWQMAALRSVFKGLPLISGFRPGAITATGNRSYHSMGRAVDVPPRWDVFNWIRSTFGARTKELIFSPAGSRQVWNGRPHVYSGITRAMHWDHVHWAMANGGLLGRDPDDTILADSGNAWLKPNTFALNKTREPEAVLSREVLGLLLNGRGGGQAPVFVTVELDGEPIKARIRAEQRGHDRGVLQRAKAGTGRNP